MVTAELQQCTAMRSNVQQCAAFYSNAQQLQQCAVVRSIMIPICNSYCLCITPYVILIVDTIRSSWSVRRFHMYKYWTFYAVIDISVHTESSASASKPPTANW